MKAASSVLPPSRSLAQQASPEAQFVGPAWPGTSDCLAGRWKAAGGVVPRGGVGVAATVGAVHSFRWSATASCGGMFLVRARQE